MIGTACTQKRAHTHTHLRLAGCVWLSVFHGSAPVLCFFPPFSPTLGASYLCRPMPPFAHTPLPCLLRGGTAASEQALPLCGADRALIWRLMLRKRLIKAARCERGRGLITTSESISTLRANWPGNEWPAAGQRLGHLMAVLWRRRWVYFYALSPSSLLPFNELGLVIRLSSLKAGPIVLQQTFPPSYLHMGWTWCNSLKTQLKGGWGRCCNS